MPTLTSPLPEAVVGGRDLMMTTMIRLLLIIIIRLLRMIMTMIQLVIVQPLMIVIIVIILQKILVALVALLLTTRAPSGDHAAEVTGAWWPSRQHQHSPPGRLLGGKKDCTPEIDTSEIMEFRWHFPMDFSGIFQHNFFVQRCVPKNCHWNCPMDFQWHFQWNFTFVISGL